MWTVRCHLAPLPAAAASAATRSMNVPAAASSQPTVNNNDMDLRPPLPPEHSPPPSVLDVTSHWKKMMTKNGSATPSSSSASSSFFLRLLLRDLLCRMYVGTEVMRLGTEARFTSLVLFHRYTAHYFRLVLEKEKEGEEEEARKPGPRNKKRKSKETTQKGLRQPDEEEGEGEGDADRQKNEKETREEVDSSKLDDDNEDDQGQKHRKHLGIVAAACLFLGCKTEEEPRRLRDVINLCHMLDFTGDGNEKRKSSKEEEKEEYQQEEGKADGKRVKAKEEEGNITTLSSSIVHIQEADEPPKLDETYWQMKEQIVITEQAVLRMLRFDVSVSHPHRAVLIILSTVLEEELNCWSDTDGDEKNKLVMGAWRLLNDALFSPRALQHPVLVLSCAALCVAAQDERMQRPTQRDMSVYANDGVEDCTAANIIATSESLDEVSSSTSTLCKTRDTKELPPYWWRALSIKDDEISKAESSLRNALNFVS